jgi:hypothetical protein
MTSKIEYGKGFDVLIIVPPYLYFDTPPAKSTGDSHFFPLEVLPDDLLSQACANIAEVELSMSVDFRVPHGIFS